MATNATLVVEPDTVIFLESTGLSSIPPRSHGKSKLSMKGLPWLSPTSEFSSC